MALPRPGAGGSRSGLRVLRAGPRGSGPTGSPGASQPWLQTARREAREEAVVEPGTWFLSAEERDNPDTRIDSRHADGLAWTPGNAIQPLVHGATYFGELLRMVQAQGPGDLLLFTDWRGDPDERLDGPGTEVVEVFSAAAARGVDVRGLLWRSHLAGGQLAGQENRSLGEAITEAGGQCLLDMRVRRFGSHHQKLVVLRHRDRPEDDIAFIGGIDLCHGRRDDAEHHGDPQAIPMPEVYGPRPPWHDIQVAVRGPAVGDAETVFRERWEDTSPLTRHPLRFLGTALSTDDWAADPLPPQAADPAEAGGTAVQLLRTYPARRPPYPFATRGESSIARGYLKVLGRARDLVYVEDQYLWSSQVAEVYASALRREPELRMIVVIPLHPDADGAIEEPPHLVGREGPLRRLREAGGDRVAVYGLENVAGTPIYVHAKACIVDDRWACIGSDNMNRRSWTHDSELSVAFVDTAGEGTPRALRLTLAEEHLGAAADGRDLTDPVAWFDAFRDAARALDDWHAGGQVGPRPPGHLRQYVQPPVGRLTRLWALPVYRLFVDPDGRPRGKRGAHRC
jgi:phosphatidylserine/phosphatidylglycerophosphate/cardiolipin synthase-like enzyme